MVTVLVATWTDGVFVLSDDCQRHELAGQPVRGLASNGNGGALAIVGGHALSRRTQHGEWTTVATTDASLACALRVGDVTYVGTDDAHVLRVSADGRIEPCSGFDHVDGRDTWYAGSAIINGLRMGPPLGIRSMTATSDEAVLLVNVHVGGIPRSTDGGVTWHPTIDVGNDVHEVRAHPYRADVVTAASAQGLSVSRDAGATWTLEREGLHASYCSAVAFSGDDLIVSASLDHFAAQGAIYRRALDGQGPLVRIGGGLPNWLDGIVDTGCIAARADDLAIADRGGNVYYSADAGRTWSLFASGLAAASSVLIV